MARKVGPKFNPYEVVTNTIVAALEAGTVPWRKPWRNVTGHGPDTSGFPMSLSSGKAYRGVNVWLLLIEAQAKGYDSPWWGTYDQIAERGGQVRKGEKGTLVVFWKKIMVDDKAVEGQRKQIMFLKTFKVFNVAQADGEVKIPGARKLAAVADAPEVDPIEACEAAVAEYLAAGPELVVGGNHASYSPTADVVRMPQRGQFGQVEEYYSALFHELTHSSGHADRLNRPGVANLPPDHKFGDELYSKEELVAEMGSAMIAAMTGIGQATIDNSASYLASWIKVLKGDEKLVVQAAAQSQRAADLILGVQYASSDQRPEAAVPVAA